MADLILTLVSVLGVAAISYGAWLAYEPAGFIVAGIVLVLVPIFYVRGSWTSTEPS